MKSNEMEPMLMKYWAGEVVQEHTTLAATKAAEVSESEAFDLGIRIKQWLQLATTTAVFHYSNAIPYSASCD